MYPRAGASPTPTTKKQQIILLCVLKILSIQISSVISDIPRPRGVSIIKSTLYPPGDTFTCIDGKKTIDYLMVNDDFCDCADGSDEPGTSACPNGQFHCVNAGYRPQNVPSSRVNDGICDCCDGSDEYNSASAQCVNNCVELGKVDRLREKQRNELAKSGNQLRTEMSIKGKALREDHHSRLEELKKSHNEAEQLKLEREQVKKEIEEMEGIALNIYREAQEKEKQKEELASATDTRQEATEIFTKFDSNSNGLLEIAELQTRIEFDTNRDGEVTIEEAKYFLNDHDTIDLNEFIISGWPRIKPFLMLDAGLFKPPATEENAGDADGGDKAETYGEDNPDDDDGGDQDSGVDDGQDYDQGVDDGQEGNGEEEDEEGEEENDGDDDGDGDDADNNNNNNEGGNDERRTRRKRRGRGTVEERRQLADKNVNYDPDTQRLIETANEARNQFSIADRELREIETEIENLELILDKDYGANDEFVPLQGECFNFEDREYVYKVCPFDRVIQQPRNGGAETKLGTWDRWDDNINRKYTIMHFSNGAACWNGPQRSTKVHLECGLETQVKSVTEPNRCEYLCVMETPAVCIFNSESSSDSAAANTAGKDGYLNHDEL